VARMVLYQLRLNMIERRPLVSLVTMIPEVLRGLTDTPIWKRVVGFAAWWAPVAGRFHS
jgi:hypothetical protein